MTTSRAVVRERMTTLLVLGLLGASPAQALDRFVNTTGTDVGDCAVLPCATIAYAVTQAAVGDTVRVAAGTYVAPIVTISKSITLAGAQSGIDARTRTGSETILSNTQGLMVSAGNVTIDGFTIRDSNDGAFTGFGVWLTPGISGSQVRNNIFENNIVALGLANAGAAPAVVTRNMFRANNLAGPRSGTAIYSDQFASDAVSDVSIVENVFVDNANGAIALASTDPNEPASAITIADNVIDGGGRGITLLQVQSTEVTGNTMTDLSAPTDGGVSAGIAVLGPATDLLIRGNTLATGPGYGIRLLGDANNLVILRNQLTGFGLAALRVDTVPTGATGYAVCNWWGSSTGPTHPSNPGGTGDSVIGTVDLANFDPWLTTPDGPCIDELVFSDGFEG